MKIRCFKLGTFYKHEDGEGKLEWACVMTTTSPDSANEWLIRRTAAGEQAFYIVDNISNRDIYDELPWYFTPQAD